MKFNLIVGKLQTINVVSLAMAVTIAGGVTVFVSAAAANSTNSCAAQAILDSQKATEIQRENLSFCEQLGASPGSSAFQTCVAGLTKIRRQHEERLNPEASNFI